MLEFNLAANFVKQNVQLVSDPHVLFLLALRILLYWRAKLEVMDSVQGVGVEEQPLNVFALPFLKH